MLSKIRIKEIIFNKILSIPAILQFRKNATLGKNVEIGWTAGCINKNGKEKIVIGSNSSISGRLVCNIDGNIKIGEYTTIRYKTIIGSAESIEIGSYCIISNNCTIYDNNNHPTSPIKRMELCKNGIYCELWDWKHSEKRRVVIEDNVWIGQNALILKGVRIGKGAIVAANTVVTKDVPSYSMIAGNPGKVVKKVETE